MKTLYRQDGTPVELSEEDAQKWLKAGLATENNPVEPQKPNTFKFFKGDTK